MDNPLSSAAALLGAAGGRAGRGSSKKRKTSFTSESGRAAVMARYPQPIQVWCLDCYNGSCRLHKKPRHVAPGIPISPKAGGQYGQKTEDSVKLWILRPINESGANSPWEPWYDKAFGFVVAAESEEEARAIAQAAGGDETGGYHNKPADAWTNPDLSTCRELKPEDHSGVVIRDFRSA